jgi:hypothetical protein
MHAWQAIKYDIQTRGQLPSSCPWNTSVDDLPFPTFLGSHAPPLSPQRLQTGLSVQRTASVVSLGSQSPALFISGQSASFTARRGFGPQLSMVTSAPVPQAAGASGGYAAAGGCTLDGRRALSFSNQRVVAGVARSSLSFTTSRSGPSQTGFRSGPTPRSSTGTGSGAALGSSPDQGGYSGASGQGDGGTVAAAVPVERRPSILAWAMRRARSPSRRFSGTSETPVVPAMAVAPGSTEATMAAAAATGGMAPATSARRLSSMAEAASPTARYHQRRASSTSHVSFLPHLGRRESETSSSGLPQVVNTGGAPDSPVVGYGAGSRRPSFTNAGRFFRPGKE